MQVVSNAVAIPGKGHNENAFDFIRFVAACGVLFSHSFPLLGKPEPKFFGVQTLGSLSVFVFFAVSGYLVMKSWDRTRSARVFSINRGLRIFPGLAVCLLLCAFVLGPIVTLDSSLTYFASIKPFAFVAFNLLMFAGYLDALPGTFQNLPFANAVNGSLWTIRYEIFMYLTLLGIVCITSKCSRVIALLLVSYISVWAIGTFQGLADPGALLWRLKMIGIGSSILNLAPFFLVGALLARVPRSYLRPQLAVIFIVAGLLSYDSRYVIVVLYFALPHCVLTLAYHAPKLINRFGKHGDFSYGMYLYAFPVQQTLTYMNVEKWWIHLLLSFVITLLLAVLSWKFIESPALKLKARSALVLGRMPVGS